MITVHPLAQQWSPSFSHVGLMGDDFTDLKPQYHCIIIEENFLSSGLLFPITTSQASLSEGELFQSLGRPGYTIFFFNAHRNEIKK